MDIQELLKPRILVIEPDTSGRWAKGDIYTFQREVAQTYDWWINQEGKEVQFNFFSSFPHLFKPLQWWEEREASEMPEYLKSADRPEVYKISHWEMKAKIGFINEHEVCDLQLFKPEYGYLPATKEEYESYINKSVK